jgi:hypothetical protein
LWPNLKYYSDICLRTTSESSTRDSHFLGRDPDCGVRRIILSDSCNWIQSSRRGSSVGIERGYGRDSIPGRGKRFFSFPQSSDRLWGLPSLLSNGYQDFFLRGQSDLGAKLTTHLHLVPRSRMVELHLHFLMRLHGLVHN